MSLKEFHPRFVGASVVGDAVDKRVSPIDDVDIFLLEILYFKGEDDEEFVHIAAEILQTPLFPRPYLRGNIVECLDTVLLGKAGYFKVEPCVIDENHHVGFVFEDILFAVG